MKSAVTLPRTLAVVLFLLAVLLFASLASAPTKSIAGLYRCIAGHRCWRQTNRPGTGSRKFESRDIQLHSRLQPRRQHYSGAMVGQDPFGSNFTTTTVDTPIIPVILITNTIAVASPNGKILRRQTRRHRLRPDCTRRRMLDESQ